MSDSPTDHDQELSYEQAREELVQVVQKLEAGAPLEESLALWERGERLAGICQQRLDGAKERVAAARRTAEESDASQE
ncbi:exodeoxyribonuclease VII small subunit [Propionibacteriaceae bacterium Y1700]|uniref:exodeoxyribonuclease VII small subunit n=1 Tax=Microlunatus sp. Y1700 TaxID=3418487 RepID=UPI003DA7171D